MVLIGLCDWCIHYNGLIDGWLPCCKAFPEGLPWGFMEKEGVECNNGFQFEVNPDKEKEFMNIHHKND